MKVARAAWGRGTLATSAWEAETRLVTLRLGRLVIEFTVGWIDREFPEHADD